ncbi:Transcription regulator of the Arc/MetJ class [Xaviernesmea oryzae]|uniref:Transcription regulator of the Arc/MetJ class n=1 Tax=Xaviernesmea oryzae TaxID=464029 RepID=A0A1X7FBR8_9HYPH|nr:type II toxin-antitoxin system VapB family antitoxin [Xaviernesmea oryzae]SMF49702.1 Transcription regulator of the Arc/MetJ class [Xaviernesmea oryzae]
MRTNIELDDELIAEAMELTGLPTKKATVEQALKDLVRIRRQMRAVDNLEGIGWEEDLDAMRNGSTRFADWGLKDPQ